MLLIHDSRRLLARRAGTQRTRRDRLVIGRYSSRGGLRLRLRRDVKELAQVQMARQSLGLLPADQDL